MFRPLPTEVVGACQDCHRPITLSEAQEEPEDGGVRFTITSDGAWHCLSHGIPSDAYERANILTFEDDMRTIVTAYHRIRCALDNGVAITPAEAAQLQVAAEDLSTCADWMEGG